MKRFWMIILALSLGGLVAVAMANGEHQSPIDIGSANEVEALIKIPHSWTVALSFSQDGDTLTTIDGHLVLRDWDPQTGELVREIELAAGSGDHHMGEFSRDASMVAIGLPDHSVGIWRTEDGAPVARLEGTSYVMATRFATDNSVLAIARFDGTVELWQLPDGKMISTWTAHESALHGLAFSNDMGTLATSSINETFHIRTWDLETERLLLSLDKHRENVYRILFIEDDTMLLSASGDRTAALWDATSGERVTAYRHHTDIVNDIALSPWS